MTGYTFIDGKSVKVTIRNFLHTLRFVKSLAVIMSLNKHLWVGDKRDVPIKLQSGFAQSPPT